MPPPRRARLHRHSSSLTDSFRHGPASTEIYTLSLHDALPISTCVFRPRASVIATASFRCSTISPGPTEKLTSRSEEHTSELQSHSELVCRLLLEKKN